MNVKSVKEDLRQPHSVIYIEIRYTVFINVLIVTNVFLQRKTLRKRTQNDEDETFYPSQDYGDDSNVDPEYRPSKKELKGADKEGDK